MTSRMRSAVLAAFVLFAPLCLDAESVLAASLIKNGSFEKPVVPNGGFVLVSTGDTFAGWAVVGASGNVAPISGNFTHSGIAFVAKRGEQWIDLTGTSNTATGVAQTIPTTPGQDYLLTFFVGNVHNPGGIFGTKSTINVLVDGSQILAATNRKGEGGNTQMWRKFSKTFTAANASTTIAFINGDPGSDSSNGLDAVSLVAAP